MPKIVRKSFFSAPPEGGIWMAVPLSYMAFIQFLTGLPQPQELEGDKFEEILKRISQELYDYPFWLQDLSHFPLFFLLFWLWAWFLNRQGFSPRKMSVAFWISLAFSVFNELVQFFVPSRFPSAGDLMMNLSGVIAARWIYHRAYDACVRNFPSKASA